MAEQKAGGYSTKYRFTSKEVNEETGLYYFGARYYDPRISLWYGVDPLAEDAPGWTPYRYGFNNPIRMIDPDGQFETEAEAKAYAKENGIKIGWFRDHKIKRQDNGTYSINKNGHMAYYYGSGAADPSEYSDNGSSNKSGNWFSNIFSIFNRKAGTAFESDNGNFGAKEHENASYGGNIDPLINTADAMKAAQGASNPLGDPSSTGEALKQLGDILDWGSDGGNIIYNLPSWGEKSRNRPDTFSWYGDKLKGTDTTIDRSVHLPNGTIINLPASKVKRP